MDPLKQEQPPTVKRRHVPEACVGAHLGAIEMARAVPRMHVISCTDSVTDAVGLTLFFIVGWPLRQFRGSRFALTRANLLCVPDCNWLDKTDVLPKDEILDASHKLRTKGPATDFSVQTGFIGLFRPCRVGNDACSNSATRAS